MTPPPPIPMNQEVSSPQQRTVREVQQDATTIPKQTPATVQKTKSPIQDLEDQQTQSIMENAQSDAAAAKAKPKPFKLLSPQTSLSQVTASDDIGADDSTPKTTIRRVKNPAVTQDDDPSSDVPSDTVEASPMKKQPLTPISQS